MPDCGVSDRMIKGDLRHASAYGARIGAGLIDVVLAALPSFVLFLAVSATAPVGTVGPGGSVTTTPGND